MSANTKIQWADHTFNPWIGCTKISPGCDHCYAEADFDKRRHIVQWGAGQPRHRTAASTWAQPLRWNKQRFMQCSKCGWRGERAAQIIGCGACGSLDLDDTRARVFCASLADVFDNEVDREWRDDLATLILNTLHLDWLLLTKRIGNAGAMLGEMFLDGPPNNVWLGATICNQTEADRDIPKLLAVPAAKRFLSMEPLLGPVDLKQACAAHRWTDSDEVTCCALPRHLDWVIVGGESGPHARPMHPDWARSLRDQCKAAGVPYFFKQWGEYAPNWYNDDAGNKVGGSEWIDRMGRRLAGRLLDGRTWDEVPA